MTNQNIVNAAGEMMSDEDLATVAGGMTCEVLKLVAKTYELEGECYGALGYSGLQSFYSGIAAGLGACK
jgi:hypothetical protein